MSKPIFEKVLIEEAVSEGNCLARVDNQVIFVKGAAPGDVMDLEITRKKKNYLEAVPHKVHTYSNARVEPFCSHFGSCGGCKWQHINYEEQLKLKYNQVVDNLTRIGKISFPQPNPILPAPKTTYYRNKLEFSFSTKRWLSLQEIRSGEVFDRGALGFHAPGLFSKVVDIDACYLQKDPSNQIRQKVKEFALQHNLSYYDIKNHQGLLRNLIIRTTTTGQIMVILQFGHSDKKKINSLLEFLLQNHPEITTLMYVVNQKRNESFSDLKVVNFHGPGYILEELEVAGSKPLQFRIGPKSFFQTNPEQANQLFGKVLELAELTGNEFVLDLYTGTGTIASLVSSLAGNVIGLDNIPEAIQKAQINAEQNHLSNLEFICGDIKDTLNDDFFAQHGKPDLVILDPPRAGLHPNLIKKLLEIKPLKIIYVSCNPATQARDLSLLDSSYQVKEIQPVDMFPHTHHVENIVRLELKD